MVWLHRLIRCIEHQLMSMMISSNFFKKVIGFFIREWHSMWQGQTAHRTYNRKTFRFSPDGKFWETPPGCVDPRRMYFSKNSKICQTTMQNRTHNTAKYCIPLQGCFRCSCANNWFHYACLVIDSTLYQYLYIKNINVKLPTYHLRLGTLSIFLFEAM